MTNLSNIFQATSLHKNNEFQLLCFYLEENGPLYGINVFKVKEIIKYDGIVTKVSYEKNSLVEGLITIRGMNIPLLDMKKWFHYNPDYPTRDLSSSGIHSKDQVIMICELSKWTIGVRIYQADRILNKKWNEIEQEISFSQNLKNTKLISRTQYFDERLVQIVDVEKMLTDVFPWIETEGQKELSNLTPIQSEKVILFADDSPTVHRAIQNILDHLNVKYYSFYNGKSLLDFIQQRTIPLEKIGLIITDLEMPEKSGFGVLKQIRENPITSHIPVVVNSSMSGNSNQEMARSLNADAFISKPGSQEIETIIKHFLEDQPALEKETK